MSGALPPGASAPDARPPGTLPPLDPRGTALVIVDLQNDFLAADGAYARGGAASGPAARAMAELPARLAPLAARLAAAGGCVAASRFTLWPGEGGAPIVSPHLARLRPFLRAGDFAPGSRGHAVVARLAPLAARLAVAGGCVAASRFTLWPGAGGAPIVSPHLARLRPFLRAGDFAPGSRGHAVVDALAPHVQLCVDKVAYSAFFHTQLEWVLRKRGIATVAVAGIVTNGGVASTVRDAFVRDFDTIVLADGCAAFSPAAHDASMADMAGIARVASCDALLAALGAAGGAADGGRDADQAGDRRSPA